MIFLFKWVKVMCLKCVIEGKMTKEELEKENTDSREILRKILELLINQPESIVINILLSCLINATKDMDINPGEIIIALVAGFDLAVFPINLNENEKEIRHWLI